LAVRKFTTLDVIELLLRRGDPSDLLRFFQDLSERLSAAFPDSEKAVQATVIDRPAVLARGTYRRMLFDRAFRRSAVTAGIPVVNRFTDPPSWSYPLTRIGAFSVTIGIVQRYKAYGSLRLRGRGRYVRHLARRNGFLNPQGSLFDPDVIRVIPNGSLGALIVVESNMHKPDAPGWVGFWVPSPNLRRPYFRCSLERLVSILRDRVAVSRRPVRKNVERKKPRLRKDVKNSAE
jgi:hypothetical protein